MRERQERESGLKKKKDNVEEHEDGKNARTKKHEDSDSEEREDSIEEHENNVEYEASVERKDGKATLETALDVFFFFGAVNVVLDVVLDILFLLFEAEEVTLQVIFFLE